MNITFLNQLRVREIQDILGKHRAVFADKKVLEIGGGTGAQAETLAGVASEVVSLEIAESNYRESANHRIVLYDGRHLPFPDSSFDVVYSSNVLEHIAHRDEFQKELMRVLSPDGYAVHSMPTQWWKLRDMVENILLFIPRMISICYKKLKNLKPPSRDTLLEYVIGSRHGEFGNTVTEFYYFMPRIWLSHFRESGWRIIGSYDGGLFYTGRTLLAERLPWSARRLLAHWFGSSVHIYILKKP